jgi:hypothetical protein
VHGLSANLALLERAWESELGAWAGMARIAALDNFSLVIEARSPAALQELTLRRRELLRRINGYFKDPFVKSISVRMAPTHGH